jgi:hypothetical protein
MASVNCRRRLLACVSRPRQRQRWFRRSADQPPARRGSDTATPIKHLIVIYGENLRSTTCLPHTSRGTARR